MCFRENSMQLKKAITLDSITKTYRLYKRNSDRIKETFHPLRKQYHRPFPALKDITFSVNSRNQLESSEKMVVENRHCSRFYVEYYNRVPVT